MIVCPHCQRRPAGEFHFGGPVRERPAADGPTDEWIAYTYDQPNRRGVQWEWWFHRSACRQWFLVRRDTRTNQYLESALPGELDTAGGGGAADGGEGGGEGGDE
jgi:heterotetrameric sarcosine oxidase delta subunit